MSDARARAAGGSCLGAVIGGALGWVVGSFGTQALEDAKFKQEQARIAAGGAADPLGSVDACFSPFVVLAGAVVGGVIGTLGGGAIGAGMATARSGPERGPIAPESPREELDRLRRRIAELEGDKEIKPDPRDLREV